MIPIAFTVLVVLGVGVVLILIQDRTEYHRKMRKARKAMRTDRLEN